MLVASRTSRLCLLLLAALSGVAVAQTATPPVAQQDASADKNPPAQQNTTAQQNTGTQQVPPPKGKVLFERHDAPPADDAGTPAAAPATEPARLKGGVSSSRRNPRVLQRRGQEAPQEAAPDLTPEIAVPPVSSSSSAAAEERAEPSPLVLTEADGVAANRVSDAERVAVRVTSMRLDLHLSAHTGEMEARAQMTLRNTGTAPAQHLPLRISGALHWESARLAGSSATLPLEQYRVPDDLDHTGAATELAVTLGEPLAPGATIHLDLYYGGTLTASMQRLTAIGAPAAAAALTDWDTVTDTFTGLRGMGSVLWYPVAGLPALLRDGDAVTRAVESSRQSNAASSFGLRLILEYAGLQPDAAFFCGERQPLRSLAGGQSSNEGGVVTAEWNRESLGLHTPSLFVADGAPQQVADGLLRVVTDRADTAAALGEAALRIRPMLADWLGAAPSRPLDVIDLPIPGGAGFADGALLVAPLTTAPAAALAPSLVQPLASAWLPDGIAAPWLRDGLPAFLQAVWAERTVGREAALAGFATAIKSLDAPAEERSASFSSSETIEAPLGPALSACSDPACARGKAAYVFEMLRGMLGDAALQQAISGWRVQEEQAHRTAAEETAAMETMLQRAAAGKKLDWFFQSWVDENRGLPDLAIVTVAPRRVERSAPVNYLPQRRAPVAGPIGAEPVPQVADPRDTSNAASEVSSSSSDAPAPAAGSWLVAVEVQNNGGADAQVPVTVRAGGLTNTLPLRVPAHGRATIRVPFEADPAEVLVNDGSVPEARVSQHRRTLSNLPAQR